MSGSGGDGRHCHDFRLVSVNMISVDLQRFSVRLFCLDHFSVFSIWHFCSNVTGRNNEVHVCHIRVLA